MLYTLINTTNWKIPHISLTSLHLMTKFTILFDINMAVDDKSESVARTEILLREVVRLAMFLLMKHPTYQAIFCRIHPGLFMTTFQEHWIDYEYSEEDSPAAVVQDAKDLVQTCLGSLDLSQLRFSWESKCTWSSRPARSTRPTNATQV